MNVLEFIHLFLVNCMEYDIYTKQNYKWMWRCCKEVFIITASVGKLKSSAKHFNLVFALTEPHILI
jgi:hypothetical protein